jgi:hypothetical protein
VEEEVEAVDKEEEEEEEEAHDVNDEEEEEEEEVDAKDEMPEEAAKEFAGEDVALWRERAILLAKILLMVNDAIRRRASGDDRPGHWNTADSP